MLCNNSRESIVSYCKADTEITHEVLLFMQKAELENKVTDLQRALACFSGDTNKHGGIQKQLDDDKRELRQVIKSLVF